MTPPLPRDFTRGQRAALAELADPTSDPVLSLSALRAGVELRGEQLRAGATLPLASAGLIAVERRLLGATLYRITDAGREALDA